jgi:hypothetical protein
MELLGVQIEERHIVTNLGGGVPFIYKPCISEECGNV